MSLESQIDDSFKKWIRATDGPVYPKVGQAGRVMRDNTPERSGHMRANTGATVDDKSTDDRIIVRLYSAPKRTPTYGQKGLKDYGSAHAQFSNARGTSKGWFPAAVSKAAEVFNT